MRFKKSTNAQPYLLAPIVFVTAVADTVHTTSMMQLYIRMYVQVKVDSFKFVLSTSSDYTKWHFLPPTLDLCLVLVTC